MEPTEDNPSAAEWCVREPSTAAPSHRGESAIVAGVIQETPDTRSYILKPPSGENAYVAGQFLTIELHGERGCLRRCYSYSSAPEVDSLPVITVKRVPGGALSNWLHAHISVGSAITILPAAGQFTLEATNDRPLLLLAAGSGITPIISLLKSALAGGRRRVRLFYASRSPEYAIFRRQLDLLKRQHERLELTPHYDDEQGTPQEGDILRALVSFGDADAYLCGPGPFMSLVERTLERHAPDIPLRTERFSGAPEPDRRPAAPADAPSVSARVRWRVRGRPLDFHCAGSSTLLEAARASGHDPPAACEEGYCGSCAAKLLHGRVHMLSCDGLSWAKREEGWILPCQALPQAEYIDLEGA